MSHEPLASIVVITYNNATTIEESLRSLANQIYPNKEIIVVYDEGSKDGTKEVLERFENLYRDFLRIISVPHMGRSKARNVGWRNSLGEIIFFADADDVYFCDYLKKAVSKLKSEPRVGCVCLTGTSLTTGKGFLAGCMEVYSKLQQVKVEMGAFRPSWAWVYRREALERVGGFDESLDQAEDKDLFMRVTGAGYGVELITGTNWLHRRPKNLWAHLRKSYLGGMRRISFLAKYRMWKELVLELLPLFILILLLALSIFYTFLVMVIGISFVALVTVSIMRLMLMVWDKVEKKRYILFYPIFGVITYLFSATGHVHGMISLLLRRLKRLKGVENL